MGKDFSKELLEIALNIIVTSRIAFGGRFFRILPLIRSIPGALLFFVFFDYDSDFLCRCFRYGVLIIRCGISGSFFIVSKSIEIAIMWCKCAA